MISHTTSSYSPLSQCGDVLDGVPQKYVCVAHEGHPEGGAGRVVLGLEAHEGQHQREGEADPGQEPGPVGLKQGPDRNRVHGVGVDPDLTYSACAHKQFVVKNLSGDS